jgi:hypothetical protein
MPTLTHKLAQLLRHTFTQTVEIIAPPRWGDNFSKRHVASNE